MTKSVQSDLASQTMAKAKLFRYLIVGGAAYLIEMAALYGLRHGLGLSPLRSVAISFWIGLVIAFLLQKLITFENYDRRAHVLAKQSVIYGVLVAWNYGFSLILVELLDESLSVFIIRTLAIAIVTSWNFFIYVKLFESSR